MQNAKPSEPLTTGGIDHGVVVLELAITTCLHLTMCQYVMMVEHACHGITCEKQNRQHKCINQVKNEHRALCVPGQFHFLGTCCHVSLQTLPNILLCGAVQHGLQLPQSSQQQHKQVPSANQVGLLSNPRQHHVTERYRLLSQCQTACKASSW